MDEFKKIIQYTEQRFKKNKRKDIINFVKDKKKSNQEFLYGIFTDKKNKKNHIGNIKLGPINKIHKTAEISYIIGDLNYQNMGIGTEAISKVIEIAKKKI